MRRCECEGLKELWPSGLDYSPDMILIKEMHHTANVSIQILLVCFPVVIFTKCNLLWTIKIIMVSISRVLRTEEHIIPEDGTSG